MTKQIPETVIAYHVTPAIDVPAILATSLQARIGPRAAAASAHQKAVYLFRTREGCDLALANRSGGATEIDSSVQIVILEVALSVSEVAVSSASDEYVVSKDLPVDSVLGIFNDDWSPAALTYGVDDLFTPDRQETSALPYLDPKTGIYDPKTARKLPADWTGLCTGLDLRTYWHIGQCDGERSYTHLLARTYAGAVIELSYRRLVTSRELRERYPTRGSMPRAIVEQLYQIRAAEVRRLGLNGTVQVSDLHDLDWGARAQLADRHFERCDPEARDALLHDEHHFVRSSAVIALQSIRQQPAAQPEKVDAI